MKFNIISYLIGEGFRNTLKNKKSTGSALIIMCAAMLIFGIFFIIGENINHIIRNIEGAQGMQVFIEPEVSEDDVKKIGEKIKEINGVNTVKFMSKKDNADAMRERLGDKAYILDDIEEMNGVKDSYVVTLTDLKLNEQVQKDIYNLGNINKITSSNETINTLINLGNGIRIVTGVILIALIMIAIFIIANTIKLTVHARRKEISIMKYVGATNSFIRWPFIVEGIISGILSALLSVLIVGVTYSIIAKNLLQTEVVKEIGISLVTFSDMFNLIFIIYIVLGIGIGVIGSTISMRKYLEV